MQTSPITFLGKKPTQYTSKKIRESNQIKKAQGWSSDDIGIVQYNMIMSARQKIREIQASKIHDLTYEKDLREREKIKKEVIKTLESAIKSIDNALSSSTIKLYY